MCFVPLRESEAGALTKYFGNVAGEDEYVTKGIESVHRNTPDFIEALQRDPIRVLDWTRSPSAVAERLQRGVNRLQRGEIPATDLCIRKRASKAVEAYDQRTQTVAALQRAAGQGLARYPGQGIEYVVIDDSRRSKARVRLAHEPLDAYDTDFYAELALRAGETILAPLGWDRQRIRKPLAGHANATLAGFDT